MKTMDTMRIAFFFSIRKKKKGEGGGYWLFTDIGRSNTITFGKTDFKL